MIVIAIIGIISAIALPKFVSLIRKSGEGSSKGNLGAIRSSLSIYYGDMEGQYPQQLAALTLSGKYLPSIPPAKTPNYHPDASAEVDGVFSAAGEAGGWVYDNVFADSNYGMGIVNCSHTDTKGSLWTAY